MNSKQQDNSKGKADRPKIRARYSSPKGNSLPRPFIIAGAVILAGAAFLFWPRGGSVPTGIGENMTVVTTSDTQGTAQANPPQSGDVDITQATMQMVPESPTSDSNSVGSKTTEPAIQSANNNPPTTSQTQKAVKPSTSKPKPTARPATPPPPIATPQATGPWALQLGAFGSEENAGSLVTRLQGKGYAAKLRTGNTSSGSMVYRVWVGYFKNRQEAENYGRAHRKQLGESIVVHR